MYDAWVKNGKQYPQDRPQDRLVPPMCRSDLKKLSDELDLGLVDLESR